MQCLVPHSGNHGYGNKHNLRSSSTTTPSSSMYIPSRSLRSASERCLAVPSQSGTKSLSRMFSFPVPGWRNERTQLLSLCHVECHLPVGKLVPLPVPHRPWSHIEIDFVTDLPNSDGNTWITPYSIHESPHSRSIQVELGNLEGFWSTLWNCYNKH